MSKPLQYFDYAHLDNQADRTLFLLHGTGGSKQDWLFLDDHLNHTYNLVSLQGNVDENGQARFFKRLEFGVFDQDSIKQEADKLQQFITAWMHQRHVTTDELTFLGYSNGANMILATLLLYPPLITTAVLLHPMLPFPVQPDSLNLSDHTVFATVGTNDPMVSKSAQEALIEVLRDSQAQLIWHEYPGGHQVTAQEMSDLLAFLQHRS